MAPIIGKCRVCGATTELTFEHVPPKAAFNDRGLLAADLTHHFMEARADGRFGDPSAMRRKKQPRGAGAYTLCGPCNNNTGAWYGREYVGWAEQGMEIRNAAPTGSSLALLFHVLPARVSKMVLCMFASACGPGLFDAEPALRRYVLNREHVGIPKRYRLYCFLLSPDSTTSRQAGITGLIVGPNFSGSFRSHTFSEISFPPFGYILSIDSDPPDKNLTDISYFTDFRINDYRDVYLKLSVRHVNTYFPGDFRTRHEWDETIARARMERNGGRQS